MKLTKVMSGLSLVFAGGLFALLATPAQAGGGLSTEDDAAIRKVVVGVEEAWNTHDMKAMEKLFTEDAEFINVVGMHWRGRKAIIAAHAAYHETSFKNHHIKTDSMSIRSLGDGQALA